MFFTVPIAADPAAATGLAATSTAAKAIRSVYAMVILPVLII
jgi:hypothetical protein